MKFNAILKGLEYRVIQGDPEVEIDGLSYDSRRIKRGDVFICIRGFKADGHDFIPDALRKGARAVTLEREAPLPEGVTGVLVSDTRKALGVMGANFYDHPSDKMQLIGVVGTNGKTTTTYLIREILMSAGHKVGLIGTIKNLIGDVEVPTERTTPESLDLQELLSRMAEEGVEYVVMEVSSHAIALKRTSGCTFKGGVFTNITQDHLDFHKTFEEYLAVKTSFFEELGGIPLETWGPPSHLSGRKTKDKGGARVAAINIDDPNGGHIAARTTAEVVTYGVEGAAMVRARDIDVTYRGTAFRMETPWGERLVHLRLTGPFNVYNALGAAALSLGIGIDIDAVKGGLEALQRVPGRFDSVDCGQDFAVIVDYAHTPDGLKNVLTTARSFARGRVICVFGCGGDRDRTKRPIMGEIAGKLSDYTIITSDNPRSEEPLSIMAQIEEGMARTNGKYHMVEERKAAIRDAIMMAKTDDVVIIAGKGHENYQIFKDRTIHFDDREVAAEVLRERMLR